MRRSGRATKGQHPKNHEVSDTPVLKPRGKAKGSKAAKQVSATPPPDDTDAIIRCICGCVEEDEDDERVMIICDKCDAWQHNECMEVSENTEELPDQYFCELCKPEDHRQLLAKVARGEKPWEERARQREIEEAERKARRRKGGKKGKKGRASEVKADDSKTNGTPATTPIKKPVATPVKKPVATPPAAPAATPIHTPHVPPIPKEKGLQPESVTQPVAVPVATPSATKEDQPERRVENGQKRKLPDEITTEPKGADEQVSQQQKSFSSLPLIIFQGPLSKVRKISSPIDTKPPASPTQRRKSSVLAGASKRDAKEMMLQTELVENISDLQSDQRRRAAEALVKLFVDQTQQAQKQGAFKLPQGQNPDAFGLRLGLAVEYAVYLNFWGQSGIPSSVYGDKFRMILHNVKANTALRDRLLSGSLSPDEFSKMSSFDMASKELQEKTAEMKKESEKQHMLIQEEGPRIRRTHKGEELVGDESTTTAADQVFSQPIPRRREPEFDPGAPKQASPEASTPHSPAAVELPENIVYPVSAGSPTTAQPLVVDTKAPPRPLTASDKQSSTPFNIQNVWSSVSGPDSDNQRPHQAPNRVEAGTVPPQRPPGPSVEADPEIDQLLKDEEPDDEEPYSPTDFAADPGSVVWRGKMSMASVAEFTGVAKHVAGANLNATFPWSQLIPSNLNIEGRIDIERASEYLCGLRWSHTNDVCVVSVTPIDDPDAHAQFEKLFKYFTERKRYGVIGKSPILAVKDIYLVPLEAGISKKPEFVELLEYCTIEDPSPERTLLLTFVIKSNNSPSAQATPRQHLDASSIASPINAGGNGQTPASFQSAGQSGSHGSPPPSYPGQSASSFAGTPPLPQQHAFVPPLQSSYPAQPTQPQFQQQQQQQNHPNGSIGMEAARKTLGDLANSPAVGQLLSEAPNMGVPEFEVIKDFLERVPAARNDLAVLKGMLTVKHQQGGSA